MYVAIPKINHSHYYIPLFGGQTWGILQHIFAFSLSSCMRQSRFKWRSQNLPIVGKYRSKISFPFSIDNPQLVILVFFVWNIFMYTRLTRKIISCRITLT